eukprot:scaffold1201_cov413-Prasinococcus_capsulatus_cf.AAC.16
MVAHPANIRVQLTTHTMASLHVAGGRIGFAKGCGFHTTPHGAGYRSVDESMPDCRQRSQEGL